jgi:hypothetical protein
MLTNVMKFSMDEKNNGLFFFLSERILGEKALDGSKLKLQV